MKAAPVRRATGLHPSDFRLPAFLQAPAPPRYRSRSFVSSSFFFILHPSSFSPNRFLDGDVQLLEARAEGCAGDAEQLGGLRLVSTHMP